MHPDVQTGRDLGLLQRIPTPGPVRRVKRGWRWFLTGERPEPRPSFIGVIEDPDEQAVGICCSGGGIRSAAFNLGALQALQQRRSREEAQQPTILQGARYLAAVSGGSYIAAGFCMVAKRWPGNGDRPETDAEGHDDSDPRQFDENHPPFHPGSPEEQYLRNRSSYLAPDGLRKLLLAYRVLLGLVFNLLFLGLALFALGVALAWLVYGPLYGALADPIGRCMELRANACSFAADIPNGFLYLLLGLGIAIVVNGMALLLLRPRRDSVRRALETWATRLMLATAALAVVLVVIPVLAEVMLNYGDERGGSQASETASAPSLPAVGVGSFATVLLAVLLQLRARAAEPATVLQAIKGARGVFRRLGTRTRLALVYVAGAIAGPLLLIAIVVFSASLSLSHSDGSGTSTGMIAAGAGALGLFLALYFAADLNTWSLHPFYRRRLCTAFALKRVADADGHPQAVEREYSRLVPLSESGVGPPTGALEWPTLIVCAAANVSDPGATPPGRGVTSFTFSANAIGGPLVGASKTVDYEDALGTNRKRDITLPAAVAMSGAALSPSMGKLTRRPFTFLMALANVRLGVWIPNPRYVESWTQRGLGNPDERRDVMKLPRPKYLFRELLGRNRLDARFLYVSDGGHYENLGLVELLRRGCTKIYCFDASGGISFTSLGDAVALARSELQVEIEIDPRPLVATGDRNLAERDCVAGTIRYPPADDGSPGPEGRLVYARTVVTEGVPWDVHAYHEADPTFPHHSTADQLYTDQKFEAYRALGWCTGHRAIELMATPATPPRPADPEPALVSATAPTATARATPSTAGRAMAPTARPAVAPRATGPWRACRWGVATDLRCTCILTPSSDAMRSRSPAPLLEHTPARFPGGAAAPETVAVARSAKRRAADGGEFGQIQEGMWGPRLADSTGRVLRSASKPFAAGVRIARSRNDLTSRDDKAEPRSVRSADRCKLSRQRWFVQSRRALEVARDSCACGPRGGNRADRWTVDLAYSEFDRELGVRPGDVALHYERARGAAGLTITLTELAGPAVLL